MVLSRARFAGGPALRLSLLLTVAMASGCGNDRSDPCAGIECSSRGFCVSESELAYCICIVGFHPVALNCVENAPADPCQGVECSGHGRCLVSGTTPECLCDEGYHHPEGYVLQCSPVVVDGGDDGDGPNPDDGGLADDVSEAVDDAAEAEDAPPGPDPCSAIPGVTYSALGTEGEVTDPPAADHPDLNIKLRGWESTGGSLELVDYGNDPDPAAPKLYALFADDRVPTFVANHAVRNWDWGSGSPGGAITDPEVTMVGLGTAAGEVLELPNSGYWIASRLQARVLFADDDSMTLKYTGSDDVVLGYTLHIVGLCVEPTLRDLYDATNEAGRRELPALTGNQPLGRARGSEVLVSIRDTGSFMDPRSLRDWW